MREVIIMHAQPSSGSMRIFGTYVRPNAACLRRLLHIVDNIICLCKYRSKLQGWYRESDLECSLFSICFVLKHYLLDFVSYMYFPVSVLASMHACAVWFEPSVLGLGSV